MRRAALLLVALSLGCRPGSSEAPAGESSGTRSQQVVAIVSGEVISARDLHLPHGATDEARRRALDQAVLRTLAAREARRRGVAERPEVAEKLAAIEREAKRREETALRDALLAALRDQFAPSVGELRLHYEATKTRYAKRQLRLRQHPFPSQEAAEQALGQMELVGEGAETLDPAPVAKLPRAVLPEALGLDRPGARAVVGSEEDGWSVIELLDVLPAAPQPFAEVREEVEGSLRTIEGEKAFRALLEDLRAKADVRIDEAALARAAPGDEASPRPRRQADD